MADFSDLIEKIKQEAPDLQETADSLELRWNEQESHIVKLSSRADEISRKYRQSTEEYEEVLLQNSKLENQIEEENASVQSGDAFRNGRNDAFVDSVRASAANDEIDFVDALALHVDELQRRMVSLEVQFSQEVRINEQLRADITDNITIHGKISRRAGLAPISRFLGAPATLLQDMERYVAGVEQDGEEQEQKFSTVEQQLDELKQMYETVDEQSKNAVEQLGGRANEREMLIQKMEAELQCEKQHTDEVEGACARLDEDYQKALEQIADLQAQMQQLQEDAKNGSIYAGSSAGADKFLVELGKDGDFIDAVIEKDLQQKEELEEATQRYDDIKEELEAQIAENGNLQQQIEILKLDIEQFQTISDKIKENKQLEPLSKSLGRSKDLLDDLEQFVATHAMEESEARNLMQAARNEADCLQQKVEQLTEQLEDAEERLGSLGGDVARLQNELQILEEGVSTGEYFKPTHLQLFERVRSEAVQGGHDNFGEAVDALLRQQDDEINGLRSELDQLHEQHMALERDVERAVPFYNRVMELKNAKKLEDAIRRPETLYEDLDRFLCDISGQIEQLMRDNEQTDQRNKAAEKEAQENAKSLLAKEQTLLERENAIEQLSKQLQIAKVNAKHYCLAAIAGLNEVTQAMILTKELARRQDEQFELIRDGIDRAATLAATADYAESSANEERSEIGEALRISMLDAQRRLYEVDVLNIEQETQIQALKKQCQLLETENLESQIFSISEVCFGKDEKLDCSD